MGAVSFMILQAEAVVQGQLRVEGRPSQSCSSTTTTSRGKNSRPRRSCCCGSSCTPLTTSTTTTTDGLQRFLLLVWLHFLFQIRPTKNNLKKAPRILRAIIQFSVKNKAQFQNDFFCSQNDLLIFWRQVEQSQLHIEFMVLWFVHTQNVVRRELQLQYRLRTMLLPSIEFSDWTQH